MKRNKAVILAGTVLLLAGGLSLFAGKYPLSIEGIWQGGMQRRIFVTLRLGRTLAAMLGGMMLGMGGYVFQLVFRNPLASPDMVGVTSGAGAGAAVGILFFGGTAAVVLCAFGGGLAAVGAVFAIAAWDRKGKRATVVLAGIAVHAMAQTVLTALKRLADPENQLAAIEYWLMGSLSDVSLSRVVPQLLLCAACMAALLAAHRYTVLLSVEEGEARMLGARVSEGRAAVVLTAALGVSAVVSMTGIISFVGLLAPHAAGRITKVHTIRTMVLSALLGGILLVLSDVAARSLGTSELPVSLFTGLIGAPFLAVYALREGRS